MNVPNEILPWHAALWERLQARIRDDLLPHALLLAGAAGLGKELFAFQLAWSLLCERPGEGGLPCGQCRSCQLLSASSHPDFLWVTLPPLGKDGRVSDADKSIIRVDHNAEGGAVRGRQILVDQARALIVELGLKSQMSGRKVAVISPADQMNWNAANALLKTLEEPAADTVLILVATDPGRLPATVRSRCQRVGFAAPAAADARRWLEPRLPGVGPQLIAELLVATGGAPLRAMQFGESGALERRREALGVFLDVSERRADPVGVARAWAQEPGLPEAAEWLYAWCCELIRLRLVGRGKSDGEPDLRGLAESVDLDTLFDRYTRIERARALTETNVKAELVLVDLLSAWAPAGR